jgi:hypothetical protein
MIPEATSSEPSVKVENINGINFDIFELEEIYGQVTTLEIMGANIFHRWNLFNDLAINYDTFNR